MAFGDTIVAVPPQVPLRALCVQENDTLQPETTPVQDLFKIRLADSHGRREAAGLLVKRRYAWRGYEVGTTQGVHPNRITLSASNREGVVATIAVGLDSVAGLFVDKLYGSEVDSIRARAQRKVCEFTKLAMDRLVRSKRVLASLFHVAYIFAHRINSYQELLIEVNPRHVLFYERMLGFEVRSEAKLNPRVDAPAVLMALDFSYGHSQIAKFGGRQDLADDERSLYPYFFAVSEEAGIVARVRRG